jgi:hypothetical protein
MREVSGASSADPKLNSVLIRGFFTDKRPALTTKQHGVKAFLNDFFWLLESCSGFEGRLSATKQHLVLGFSGLAEVASVCP